MVATRAIGDNPFLRRNKWRLMGAPPRRDDPSCSGVRTEWYDEAFVVFLVWQTSLSCRPGGGVCRETACWSPHVAAGVCIHVEKSDVVSEAYRGLAFALNGLRVSLDATITSCG